MILSLLLSICLHWHCFFFKIIASFSTHCIAVYFNVQYYSAFSLVQPPMFHCNLTTMCMFISQIILIVEGNSAIVSLIGSNSVRYHGIHNTCVINEHYFIQQQIYMNSFIRYKNSFDSYLAVILYWNQRQKVSFHNV